MWGLSLVAASGGHSSSRCVGLSLSRPLLLWSTGSRCAGSVVVAHGPSRSAACGIFPDQGSNPCPLRWQADSQPLRHQGSPLKGSFFVTYSSKRKGCQAGLHRGLPLERVTASWSYRGSFCSKQCAFSYVSQALCRVANLNNFDGPGAWELLLVIWCLLPGLVHRGPSAWKSSKGSDWGLDLISCSGRGPDLASSQGVKIEPSSADKWTNKLYYSL